MPKLPKLELRRNLRSRTWLQILLVLGLQSVLPSARDTLVAQSDRTSEVFTEAAASSLLQQVAEGLQGHSARKMLSAFDLSRMDDGPLFRQQITAFFNHYDSIRVHFKLLEVKDNVASVDAEIDQTPLDSANPPERKTVELHLTGAKTATGWKFIEVQPRNFFS